MHDTHTVSSKKSRRLNYFFTCRQELLKLRFSDYSTAVSITAKSTEEIDQHVRTQNNVK